MGVCKGGVGCYAQVFHFVLSSKHVKHVRTSKVLFSTFVLEKSIVWLFLVSENMPLLQESVITTQTTRILQSLLLNNSTCTGQPGNKADSALCSWQELTMSSFSALYSY